MVIHLAWRDDGGAVAVLAVLFGLAAGVLFIASSLPQAVKVWQAGSADGVNVGMWVAMFGLLSAWLGYALRSGNPTLLLANAGGLASCGVVLLAIARSRRARTWLVLLAMAAGGGLLTLTALVVPLPVLAVAFLAGTIIPWMQPVTSLRTWRSGGASEVSIASFVLRGLTQVAWLGQCLFTRDAVVVMTATLTLLAVLATIALELAVAARAVPARA